jgi:hypothetical protein
MILDFSIEIFYGKVVISCAADYDNHLHPENFDVPFY